MQKTDPDIYALDVYFVQVSNAASLLLERSKKWRPVLDKAILQTECFVALGVKHSFYKQGLIQQLRSLRDQVKPIPAE